MIRLSHPTAAIAERLLRLRLGAMRGVGLSRWARRLGGASAAEIEMISLDALRHAVIDGATAVSDAHLEASVARLRARKKAVLSGQTAEDGGGDG